MTSKLNAKYFLFSADIYFTQIQADVRKCSCISLKWTIQFHFNHRKVNILKNLLKRKQKKRMRKWWKLMKKTKTGTETDSAENIKDRENKNWIKKKCENNAKLTSRTLNKFTALYFDIFDIFMGIFQNTFMFTQILAKPWTIR